MSYVVSHTDVLVEDGNTDATTVIDTYGFEFAGLIIPSGFEGTAITFEASDDDTGTYLPCHNTSGTEISLTVAASRHVLLDPATFKGARYVKVICGTAQTGDITLKAVLRQDS